ncbi:MAG TPA: PDZ domain-containing protein [Polyangiaceae bacterium]
MPDRVTSARARTRPCTTLMLSVVFVLATACMPNQGTIGALLGQQQDGRLFVREVPPQLAAERAGLRAGDEILLVDGRDVRDMTAKQIHGLLSGEVGQPVKLTVLRGEEVMRLTLKRTPARKSAPFAAKSP